MFLGEAHTHRTGQPHADVGVSTLGHKFLKNAYDYVLCVGIMPFIFREQHVFGFVNGYNLGRRRTNVYSYPNHSKNRLIPLYPVQRY